ncbi:MAG TPA: hypothetical protein VHO43_01830 [Ignavibacteriales bacterium]|nr:hypothetical protein [Ignavibacteriales bacterium]
MFTQDESNYLRGLIILAAVDRDITESERKFIMDIGKKLGFERRYCAESIEGVLNNEYLDQTIPVFSNPNTAEKFLQDCYRLAMVDNQLNFKEASWINVVAINNNILHVEFMEDS